MNSQGLDSLELVGIEDVLPSPMFESGGDVHGASERSRLAATTSLSKPYRLMVQRLQGVEAMRQFIDPAACP